VILSLLSVSIFTLDVRASSPASAPAGDEAKYNELVALLRSDDFRKNESGEFRLQASAIVLGIQNPMQRLGASSLINSTEIVHLNSKLQEQAERIASQDQRIAALENKKCCCANK